MNASVKDLQQPLNRVIEKDDFQQASTPRPQDESQRKAWRQELGRMMVENNNRMENDLAYRREIQSRTR